MKGGSPGYNKILLVLTQVGILYEYVHVCMYTYIDTYFIHLYIYMCIPSSR